MIKENKQDSPGVFIPPPLIYTVIFLISIFIQNLFPISKNFFKANSTFIAGWVLITACLVFVVPAIEKFIRAKNTLILIKPAESLQTSRVYSLTRNPMYLGLLLLYSGLALIFGNWWTLILIPVLILIMNFFVIRNEEKYLERAFGQDYFDYKKKVRQWI
jgi:protein-S-isoprenylcysteine O-methyltransferase Ste14